MKRLFLLMVLLFLFTSTFAAEYLVTSTVRYLSIAPLGGFGSLRISPDRDSVCVEFLLYVEESLGRGEPWLQEQLRVRPSEARELFRDFLVDSLRVPERDIMGNKRARTIVKGWDPAVNLDVQLGVDKP